MSPREAIRSDITGDRLPTWGTSSKEALSDKGLPLTPQFLGGQGQQGPRGSSGAVSIPPQTFLPRAPGPHTWLHHPPGAASLGSKALSPPFSHSLPGWEAISPLKGKVAQSCLTLCNPMNYKVHGILQARRLEWVAFPFSRGSSQPRDRTQVSHTAGRFFTS